MLNAMLASWSQWWDSVTPAFLFLFALPFIVAAAAFVAEAVRQRRRRR